MFSTIRLDVPLDSALEQIIRRLRRMERRDRAKRIHLRRAEIADADRPDFPRAKEIRHGFRGLRDGSARIGPMHLVKIDHVGLQAPQRILDLLHYPHPAAVTERRAVAPIEADLGRDDGAFPAAILRQGLAENLFGPAEAVDRRGVEQRDALIERGVDRADRLRLVRAAPHPTPDRPSAQSDS
jgi:hypothetical protein